LSPFNLAASVGLAIPNTDLAQSTLPTRLLRMISIKEVPVDNFRRMRVVVIGAGFSGLYLSIRIPEWLRNVDLVTYEQNAGVGGTWWMNRYPGCACDIPCKPLEDVGQRD